MTANHWSVSAACSHSPIDWFPRDASDRELTRGPEIEALKSVCRLTCPVILECGMAGMKEPEGVWGGMGKRERDRLAKRVRTGVPFAAAHEEIAGRGLFA